MFNLLLVLMSSVPAWIHCPSFTVSKAMPESPQTQQKVEKLPFKITINFLDAFEYSSRPLGAGQNYAKGHAVVRLRIENLSQSRLDINLQRIEIQRSDNRQVLLTQPMRLIQLQGLQILDPGQHLTIQQGFAGAKRLTAILTYKFNSKSYVVHSLPTEIKIYPK